MNDGKLSIKSDVFRHSYGKEYAGIKIGTRKSEPALYSKARELHSIIDRGVVAFAPILAFDRLATANCVEVGDAVVLRTRSMDNEVYISFDGSKVKSTENFSHIALYAVLIAWATRTKSAEPWAKECKTLTSQLIKSVREGTIVKNQNVLWTFCDNFYYGMLYSHPEIEIEVDGLSLSSAQMAFSTADACHEIFADNPIEETSEKKAIEKDSFFEDCKAGQYVIAYDWPKEVEKYILPLSSLDNFAPNETFQNLVKRIYKGMSQTIEEMEAGIVDLGTAISRLPQPVLAGTPGTGKTRVLMAVAAALGVPFYSVPMTATTEADTFYGMNGIDEDGRLTHIVTDCLLGHRMGGIVVLEEANLASANLVTGTLNQELESPYFLTEFGYDKTFRNPLTVYALTMNPNTYGTGRLNQAFASRQSEFIILENPEENAFVEQTQAQYGTRWNVKQIKFAYDIMQKTTEFLCSIENNAEEIAEAVTPRLAVNFLKQCEVADVMTALNRTFIGVVSLYDSAMAKQLLSVFTDTMTLRYPS